MKKCIKLTNKNILSCKLSQYNYYDVFYIIKCILLFAICFINICAVKKILIKNNVIILYYIKTTYI